MKLIDKYNSFIGTLEMKEKNFIWKNARTTVPEDSTNQIICIKEDGLAVSTVGKIVNGTIKWAYLDDLLNTTYSRLDGNNKVIEEYDEDELEILPNKNLTKMIPFDKAYKWLEENLAKETTLLAFDSVHISFEHVFEEFKKAMLD